MRNVRDLFKLREGRIWSEKALNVAPRPGTILSEAFWVVIFYFLLPPTLVPSQIGSAPDGFAYHDGDLDDVGDAAPYFHYRPSVLPATSGDLWDGL